MKAKAIISFFILFAHLSFAQNKTYYISTNGNDINNGLSILTPWKTLSKINMLDLEAGDKILLEGGSTFTGSVQLNQYDGGTPDNPVVISSYGAGKAKIYSPNETALYASDVAGIKITNLIFQGNNSNTNGIYFEINQTPNDIDFILIDNIEVFDFSGRGFFIGSRSTDKGFNNVSILHSSFHNNGLAGMETFGNTAMLSHTDFTISYCKFYDNYGTLDPNAMSGNGLIVSGVDGATVNYCEAYNNGSNNRGPAGGPVGIWVYEAKNVTIQHCESHHNKAGKLSDGGGFDIDGGSQNCTIQYCYSHDNEGPGLAMVEYGSTFQFTGNVIRYNISQDDGRKNSSGALAFHAVNALHQVTNSRVYNNTIFMDAANLVNGLPVVVSIASAHFSDVQISNNIFYASSGVEMLYSASSLTPDKVLFLNNNYYSVPSDYHFYWNDIDYSSLNGWKAATGQEMNGSTSMGSTDNPLFINAGIGGLVNPADGGSFNSLFGYTLNPSSPLVNQGMNLANMGAFDFFGNAVPQFSNYDIGAAEVVVSTPLPLTFANFGAVVQHNEVLIQWKVYNETNVKNYEVLKSNNGIQFFNISTITPAYGNTYMFTDDEKPGNSFYRIKYVNADGSSGMSSTVKVSAGIQKDLAALYTEGQGLQLQIWRDQKTTAFVRIYNTVGQLLSTSQFQVYQGNNNIIVHNVNRLKAGVYFVAVTPAGDATNVSRFVKSF